MIHFERSFDYELIRKIITHPRIYKHLVDDRCPPPEEYSPPQGEHIWYILVHDIYPDAGPEELLGCWIIHPHNSICYEIHTALLPNAWGETAHRAVRLVFEWIWEHTPCLRLITTVPYPNRLALHFAYRAGMTVYGTNHQSWLQDGKLWDQICLGINKPEKKPPTVLLEHQAGATCL